MTLRTSTPTTNSADHADNVINPAQGIGRQSFTAVQTNKKHATTVIGPRGFIVNAPAANTIGKAN
jgi:hypothetical protein